MKSVISGLYYRNISPFENTLPKEPEYHIENKKICEKMDKLKEELSEDIYKRIIEIVDLHGLIFSMEAEQSFRNGFELGSMIMIEVHADKEGGFLVPKY